MLNPDLNLSKEVNRIPLEGSLSREYKVQQSIRAADNICKLYLIASCLDPKKVGCIDFSRLNLFFSFLPPSMFSGCYTLKSIWLGFCNHIIFC